MGPLVTRRAPRARARLRRPRREGRREARRRRTRAQASRGAREGFFLGPCLFDDVAAGRCASTTRRSSGPCCASCACRTSRRRSSSSTSTSSATARRSSRASGEAARTLRAGRAGRHGRHQRADPGADGVSFSFGGWKRSLFGPLHVHGPDGVRFYTRLKTVTSRWPTTRPRKRAVRHADDEIMMESTVSEARHDALDRNTERCIRPAQ